MQLQLQEKYSLESTDPRESEIRAPPQLTIALKLSYYLFIIAKLFKIKDGCLKFVYNIKITGLRRRHRKHLLIYDVHMYQCIDIHWKFFLRVGTFIDDE